MARKGGNPDINKIGRKFTSETAKKAVQKRIENYNSRKALEGQLDKLVTLVTSDLDEAHFAMAVRELPTPLLRIYGNDLTDKTKAREVCEDILNRILGRPKQAVETKVDTNEGFNLVVSKNTADLISGK